MGSWRNASLYSSGRQRGDWGVIHLDGDDELSVRKRDDPYVYVRNLGMGIEGRPLASRAPSESGTLHNRTPRHQRRSSGMSLWTWASGRTTNEEPGGGMRGEDQDQDDDVETIDELNRRQERQIITTLALLQVFHKHTSQLLTRLSRFLPDEVPSDSASGSSSKPKSTISLSPRDVMSVELGPLSTLDARFVEWLVEEYGNGAKVVVKRGWRDLFGLMLGFG